MVARATTYSGKVARIVHVFSEEALAEYAAHCVEEEHGEMKVVKMNKTDTLIKYPKMNKYVDRNENFLTLEPMKWINQNNTCKPLIHC